MRVEELKELEHIAITQVDPSKRHILVVDDAWMPKSAFEKLGDVWKHEFGNTPILVYKSAFGEFHVLEIKP